MFRVATPGGFEPPISTVTGWHVSPLHYGAVLLFIEVIKREYYLWNSIRTEHGLSINQAVVPERP